MWDRAILKSNAKLALRGRYWTAFAASLVAMILTGGYSMFTWRQTVDKRVEAPLKLWYN